VTARQQIDILGAGPVLFDDLGAHSRAHAEAEVPSIWRQEKVVSKCAPGEALHVPGYPG
jgi:hypothetical protein